MQSYIPRQNSFKSQRADLKLTKSALEEIGHVLKEEREKKSLTIKDIKEKTCIPAHHVVAIEEGRREELPEDLFLTGFIKRYAKILDLNENALCETYMKGKRGKNPNNEQNAFDLLFQEEKESKIIQFNKEKRYLDDALVEKSFFKVYHLYFFLTIFLFLLIGFLTFHNSSKEGIVKESIPLVLEESNSKAKNVETKSENIIEKSKKEAKPKAIKKNTKVVVNTSKPFSVQVLRGNVQTVEVVRKSPSVIDIKSKPEPELRPLRM